MLKCHVEICHSDTEDSVCETGCFDTATTTTTSTSTTTTTTSTTTEATDPCDDVVLNDDQYCYVIPDTYEHYDNYDENTYYYHGIDEIQAGNAIIVSKKCHDDFHIEGTYWNTESNYGNYGCDFYGDFCTNLPAEYMLMLAVPTENGYITILNCPVCGCTENDIITLDERSSWARSMSMSRDEVKAILFGEN